MASLTREENEDLARQARMLVRAGYDEPGEIEDWLDDLVADFETEISERDRKFLVRTALITAVQDLLEDQKTWPERTDYDRLKLAMQALEAEGIIARENFWCCGTCGAAAISDEIHEALEAGTPVRGYVFFHEQDTQGATDPDYGSLYFNYGHATSETEADNLGIAAALIEQLKATGLTTEWDGSWNMRVMAKVDWKRPWTRPVPKPLKRWMF